MEGQEEKVLELLRELGGSLCWGLSVCTAESSSPGSMFICKAIDNKHTDTQNYFK